MLRSLGAHIWRVDRDCRYHLSGPSDTHQSESEMDEIVPDLIINNSFGLSELEETVSHAMEMFTT